MKRGFSPIDMALHLKSILAIIATFCCIDVAAAENGEPVQPNMPRAETQALIDEGIHYEHGEGVARDYAKALSLYCAAAKAGSPDGMYALGWMYANGRGVARENAVARRLFESAAEQGHQHSRQILLYFERSSVPAEMPACLLPDPVPSKESDEQSGSEHVFPKGPISGIVDKLAPRYGIDPRLALAIITVESGFNARAVSAKNARGLMQLMPQTAQRFRVENVFDPEDNIKGGLSYLRWLLAYFKGDVALVAAAYNAGEGSVEKYRGVPPYAETKQYVKKIAALYGKQVHPYQESIVNASLAMARMVVGAK
jgi:TPR repeat protein